MFEKITVSYTIEGFDMYIVNNSLLFVFPRCTQRETAESISFAYMNVDKAKNVFVFHDRG